MALSAYLKELGLLDWKTLLVGLKNQWAVKSDAIELAVDFLEQGGDDQRLALVAGGEDQSLDELIALIDNYCSEIEVDTPTTLVEDKWLLVHLEALLGSDGSWKEKVDSLQELYTLFDYREDMASCSVYSSDDVDPVEGMKSLVRSLKASLGIGPVGAK